MESIVINCSEKLCQQKQHTQNRNVRTHRDLLERARHHGDEHVEQNDHGTPVVHSKHDVAHALRKPAAVALKHDVAHAPASVACGQSLELNFVLNLILFPKKLLRNLLKIKLSTTRSLQTA